MSTGFEGYLIAAVIAAFLWRALGQRVSQSQHQFQDQKAHARSESETPVTVIDQKSNPIRSIVSVVASIIVVAIVAMVAIMVYDLARSQTRSTTPAQPIQQPAQPPVIVTVIAPRQEPIEQPYRPVQLPQAAPAIDLTPLIIGAALVGLLAYTSRRKQQTDIPTFAPPAINIAPAEEDQEPEPVPSAFKDFIDKIKI